MRDHDAIQDLTRRLNETKLAEGAEAARIAVEQGRQLIRAAYDASSPSGGKPRVFSSTLSGGAIGTGRNVGARAGERRGAVA